MGGVLAQVQNGSQRVFCYESKSFRKVQRLYSNTKRELLAIVNFTRQFKQYLLGRELQNATDHRALQWLDHIKDLDGLTARWLEKLAAFEYRSEKNLGHVDSMSRVPSQDATTNQVDAHTRGAEAKHPTENNDAASDTNWPSRPRTNEKKRTGYPARKAHYAKIATTASLYARCRRRGKSTKF